MVNDRARGEAPHSLLAVGHKVWGIPLILPFAKLYDFGLYVDRGKARQSELRRALSGDADALRRASPDFYRQLRDADDVNWTLVVVAARSLPIGLLRAEYTRILSKRIRAVGGSHKDPALHTLLQLFR